MDVRFDDPPKNPKTKIPKQSTMRLINTNQRLLGSDAVFFLFAFGVALDVFNDFGCDISFGD